MRVLLAVHHFPPRYSAGAELYTYRLARWLIRRGHEAEVVCVERIDARGAGPLRAHADTYEGVPVWRLDLDLRKAPAEWVFRNEAVMAWAAEHLATYRPDLVHLQSGYLITPSVLEAAIGRGIATAVTLHDYWFLCPRITLLRGDGSLCAGSSGGLRLVRAPGQPALPPGRPGHERAVRPPGPATRPRGGRPADRRAPGLPAPDPQSGRSGHRAVALCGRAVPRDGGARAPA